MRRPLATMVLVMVMALNASAMLVSPAAQAQDATPGSTPLATSAQLDLPAMVLLPEDLGQLT